MLKSLENEEADVPCCCYVQKEVSWKVKAVLEGSTQLRTLLAVVRVERSLIRTLASPSEW